MLPHPAWKPAASCTVAWSLLISGHQQTPEHMTSTGMQPAVGPSPVLAISKGCSRPLRTRCFPPLFPALPLYKQELAGTFTLAQECILASLNESQECMYATKTEPTTHPRKKVPALSTPHCGGPHPPVHPGSAEPKQRHRGNRQQRPHHSLWAAQLWLILLANTRTTYGGASPHATPTRRESSAV